MSIIELPEQAAGEQTIDEAVSKHPDAQYEIVNDQYVELPPMSTSATVVASRLMRKLGAFADSRQLGEVVAQPLFPMAPGTKTRRRPDVAFVSNARWPKDRPLPNTDPWPVTPELAIEVVSPTDLVEELFTKLMEYFQVSVNQVWVVFPKQRLNQVYQSLTSVHGLTSSDELDGGDLLPGFRLPVTFLFQGTADNGTPNPT
jgi:Uma2 family endonuclease